MSVSVTYNGYVIKPIGTMSVSKTYNTQQDGQKLGGNINLTLQGTVLPFKGSPLEDGSFHTDPLTEPTETSIANRDQSFEKICVKEQAIRDVFSNNGRLLEIHCGADSVMRCWPTSISLTFDDSNRLFSLPYTINITAPLLTGMYFDDSGNPYGEDVALQPPTQEFIESASEDWNLTLSDSRTVVSESGCTVTTGFIYDLTHTVNAVGKLVYDPSGSILTDSDNDFFPIDYSTGEYDPVSGINMAPWMWARRYVQERAGYDDTVLLGSGFMTVCDGFTPYNHRRTETRGVTDGSYSVTETWSLAEQPAIEDFTVTCNYDQENGLNTVGINGTITGLELLNYTSGECTLIVDGASKWDNAFSYWMSIQGNLLNRAECFSGLDLYDNPRNTSVAKNPVAGTISYNYGFDDNTITCIQVLDASGNNIVLNEDIQFTDTGYTDVFAQQTIPGSYCLGPILQPAFATNAYRKSISISLLLDIEKNCTQLAGLYQTSGESVGSSCNSVPVPAWRSTPEATFGDSSTVVSSSTGQYVQNIVNSLVSNNWSVMVTQNQETYSQRRRNARYTLSVELLISQACLS